MPDDHAGMNRALPLRMTDGYREYFAISPDSSTMACAYQYFVDTLSLDDDGEEMQDFEESPRVIHGIAYAPDGLQLACASDDGILLYNVKTGKSWRTLGRGKAWGAVAYLPDGTLLVSDDDDGLCMWRRPYVPQAKSLAPPASCLAVADTLFASGDYEGDIMLWRHNGAHERTLLGHASVEAMAFYDQGARLVSVGDASWRVWNVGTGECLHEMNLGTELRSVAVSPTGLLAITSTFQDDKVWIYRTSDFALVKTLDVDLTYPFQAAFRVNGSGALELYVSSQMSPSRLMM